MTRTLPQPERTRWQPLRIGLVELYHYDVEEFWFRDGHLLLRGNNGTGKSKVLSLTLPFLLDAQLSATRIEPDGDRTKRMDWNLLMGNRYERRVGYAWLELGRIDEAGEARTLTLGCGLRAVAGRSEVDSWFFVTDQRVGGDLWLTTHERTAISRDKLIDAIGTRGHVYKTAQEYRRAVDERLFRLGTDRYRALVDTLIQLRQPQLSKQPNEQRLSDALTEALAPLDHTALENVADALGQLEDLRRELDELGAIRDAVASFGKRYRRYAQMATRRRARVVRQAQTEFDNASRDLHAAEAELQAARAEVREWQSEQQQLEGRVAEARARLGVLQAHPVMREAHRIAGAREHAARQRTAAREAEQRVTALNERLQTEQNGTTNRKHDAQVSRSALATAMRETAEHADAAGVAAEHAAAIADIELPDGAATAPADFADAWLRAARTAAARRREQIDTVRKRLRDLGAAESRRDGARTIRDQSADAFDQATAQLKQSVERLRSVAAETLAAWRTHVGTLEVLEIEEPEERFAALEVWLETLTGANPLRAVLDAARQSTEQTLAAREAALAAERAALDEERQELVEEQARLARGEDRRPPVPYTRGADARAARSGAPLWQLVDFAPHVTIADRAGLEAALEAGGLLDAWVSPDGSLVDARTHDVVLTARAACPAPLAEWLVVTVPPNAAAGSAEAVAAVLRSIACAAEEPATAEAWVSARGEFRIGPARGAWSKPQAEYIGHAAREAARRARIAAITERLGELAAAAAKSEDAGRRCAALRAKAQQEYAAAPPDEALLRASAERNTAERERRRTQAQLGETEARLAAAEQLAAAARAQLTSDAHDLRLPSDDDGLDRAQRAVGAYREAGAVLAGAARAHRRALLELEEQLRREERAHEDAGAATADRAAKHTALLEADAVVESLQTTVGKQVDELLADIDAAKKSLETNEAAEKRARAQLVVASANRGTAEKDHDTKQQRLAERVDERRNAIATFEAFTVRTELVAVALADVPDAASIQPGIAPWGVDAALTLARRAEQALAQVPAEDTDWSRVQSDLSHDLAALQSAMSARGQSATAELGELGVVVRMVYQQRSIRPDVLERQLDADLGERKLILSAQERAVLEEHLEKEIAANLQHMIQDADRQVLEINDELARRPTSTGVRYRLVWQPIPEDDEGGVPGLAAARKRLLKTSADAWSADDRRQVGEFLRARIAAEAESDEQATMLDNLRRALDYRRWHRFRVQRLQDDQWRPLAGPASSGERALGLTVPLFAACSSHYKSADPNAPRLVLLDEAFAGIDDEARASCMALIREFDLDFVMTSEREWGCYPALPGLSICQLVRREGMDAVLVSRWTWNGRERRPGTEMIQRFPERAATLDEASRDEATIDSEA